jgi:hypothetical protein
VTPPPPGGGGTGTPNPFGCYKLKCPKGTVPPTLALHDQFGSRVVTPSKAKMLCAPGEGVTTTTVTSSTTTTTTPCTQAFEPTIRVAGELSEALAPDGDYPFPVSCGGSPAMCCPGGVPTSSCGPLHFEPSSVTIVEDFGQYRMDVTYRGRAATVTDVPVTIPLVGECQLRIDTTAGSSNSMRIDYRLVMNAAHDRVFEVANVLISETEADYFSLVGGFACQIADLGLGLYVGMLTDAIADALSPEAQLCRFCNETVGPCPP